MSPRRHRTWQIREAQRWVEGPFSAIRCTDMIEAQYRLLNEALQVSHLRLVMGTSMGGMHTWVWAVRHPGFMDALMPLASLPTQIPGRNPVWRKTMIGAIRNDHAWKGGNYRQSGAGSGAERGIGTG